MSDPSCDAKCAAGYYTVIPPSVDKTGKDSGPIMGRFMCHLDVPDQSTALSPFVCVEVFCLPFTGPGVVPAEDGNGCVPGENLWTISRPSCTVTCDDGYSYSGSSAVEFEMVTCPINATFGTASESSIDCEENQCQDWDDLDWWDDAGMEGAEVTDADTGRVIAPCSMTRRLSTRLETQCGLQCKPGYHRADVTVNVSAAASAAQAVALCASTAQLDDAATLVGLPFIWPLPTIC